MKRSITQKMNVLQRSIDNKRETTMEEQGQLEEMENI